MKEDEEPPPCVRCLIGHGPSARGNLDQSESHETPARVTWHGMSLCKPCYLTLIHDPLGDW